MTLAQQIMHIAVHGKVTRRASLDEGDCESGPIVYTALIIRMGKAEIAYGQNGSLWVSWPKGEDPTYGKIEGYWSIERSSAIAFVCSRRFLSDKSQRFATAYGGGAYISAAAKSRPVAS